MAKHKYHILVWNAADITKFLALEGLSFAVFNFDKPLAGYFRLEVTGFNTVGDFIGDSNIEKYSGVKEPDLENAYSLGLFFVKAEEIRTFSAKGTKTIYFMPNLYKATGGTKEYVAYSVYDAPPKDGVFVSGVVGSINPSPPRNA